MRSLPMAYHRIIHTTMYTDEDNSTDLIGAFCELLFPRKGHSNGIIVDDYGTEWLVQLTNGLNLEFGESICHICQVGFLFFGR